MTERNVAVAVFYVKDRWVCVATPYGKTLQESHSFIFAFGPETKHSRSFQGLSKVCDSLLIFFIVFYCLLEKFWLICSTWDVAADLALFDCFVNVFIDML